MVAKPQRFKLLLFIYSATCNLYTKADISKTVKLWESEWMICGKAEHRYSEELQINNITQSVWFELSKQQEAKICFEQLIYMYKKRTYVINTF